MTDPWLIQNTSKYNEPEAKDGGSQNGHKQEAQQQEYSTTETNCFEDNFAPLTATGTTTANAHLDNQATAAHSATSNSNNVELQVLPDSASYLQGLERKLQKIKKGTKLVESLAEKRQSCLRTLLLEGECNNGDVLHNNNNAILALDTPISNGDSTVQEIYRHLQPVQPVTVGELVHIVKYDHLEEQQQDALPGATEDEEASK